MAGMELIDQHPGLDRRVGVHQPAHVLDGGREDADAGDRTAIRNWADNREEALAAEQEVAPAVLPENVVCPRGLLVRPGLQNDNAIRLDLRQHRLHKLVGDCGHRALLHPRGVAAPRQTRAVHRQACRPPDADPIVGRPRAVVPSAGPGASAAGWRPGGAGTAARAGVSGPLLWYTRGEDRQLSAWKRAAAVSRARSV